MCDVFVLFCCFCVVLFCEYVWLCMCMCCCLNFYLCVCVCVRACVRACVHVWKLLTSDSYTHKKTHFHLSLHYCMCVFWKSERRERSKDTPPMFYRRLTIPVLVHELPRTPAEHQAENVSWSENVKQMCVFFHLCCEHVLWMWNWVYESTVHCTCRFRMTALSIFMHQ